MIHNIKHDERPPRPTDPSQNQWLQDHVWDTITTCWGGRPEFRCGVPVMCHGFTMLSPQDLLVEFPPIGRKNLIRLAEELSYTFLILPLDPGVLARLTAAQRYISDVISADGNSPLNLSSADAEAFRKVPFPC